MKRGAVKAAGAQAQAASRSILAAPAPRSRRGSSALFAGSSLVHRAHLLTLLLFTLRQRRETSREVAALTTSLRSVRLGLAQLGAQCLGGRHRLRKLAAALAPRVARRPKLSSECLLRRSLAIQQRFALAQPSLQLVALGAGSVTRVLRRPRRRLRRLRVHRLRCDALLQCSHFCTQRGLCRGVNGWRWWRLMQQLLLLLELAFEARDRLLHRFALLRRRLRLRPHHAQLVRERLHLKVHLARRLCLLLQRRAPLGKLLDLETVRTAVGVE